MYSTMAQLIAAANASDSSHQWFSPATMETWGTRIESDVIGGHWFITSEDRDDERVFSIRYCDVDGETRTAPGTEVGAYADLDDATEVAEFLATIVQAYRGWH